MNFLEFLDKWIFIFSFIVIIAITIWIVQTNKKQWVIKQKLYIAWFLACFQLVVWIGWNTANIVKGGWFHILMTDLCPLISFISIPVFMSAKERFLKMLMPWLFIGSIVTAILGGGEFAKVSIEKGTYLYLRHTLMFVQAIFTYLVISKYSKKEKAEILVFPVFLVMWVLIGALIPWKITGDVRWAIFSTGMLPPSYTVQTVEYGGLVEEYGSFSIMGDVGWPYPLPTIIFYILAVGTAYGITWHKNSGYDFWLKIGNKIKNRKKQKSNVS